MPKIRLQGAAIVSRVGQGEAAGVSQHVRVSPFSVRLAPVAARSIIFANPAVVKG